MDFWIDFESEEAFYIQLRNQIVIAIATQKVKEGEVLPSVRQLASDVGINMHTVNKAYNVLRQEGFIRLESRTKAVVDLGDSNKGDGFHEPACKITARYVTLMIERQFKKQA